MLQILSFPLTVFLENLESSELNVLNHGAFPPDKFALGVGPSNSILIVPDITIFVDVDLLRLLGQGIVEISVPQEIAIVSSPLGDANKFGVGEYEYLVSVGSVVVVLERELQQFVGF